MKAFTHRRYQYAFTLLDLTVLLVLVPALLCGMTCGGLGRSGETANRVKCASHLRSIGQAILLYSNENRGAYPRTIATAGPPVTPVWATGAESSSPFLHDGREPNDVSAALFLLLRTQDATSEIFNCPSSNAEKDTYAGKSSIDRSNFSNIKKHLSYSYQNPYPTTGQSDAAFNSIRWTRSQRTRSRSCRTSIRAWPARTTTCLLSRFFVSSADEAGKQQ